LRKASARRFSIYERRHDEWRHDRLAVYAAVLGAAIDLIAVLVVSRSWASPSSASPRNTLLDRSRHPVSQQISPPAHLYAGLRVRPRGFRSLTSQSALRLSITTSRWVSSSQRSWKAVPYVDLPTPLGALSVLLTLFAQYLGVESSDWGKGQDWLKDIPARSKSSSSYPPLCSTQQHTRALRQTPHC
jgi:hypothetical protein